MNKRKRLRERGFLREEIGEKEGRRRLILRRISQ